MTVKISDLFTIEKGSLQSSKNTAGKYTFITAAEEWKNHDSYSHDCEALIFAAAASGSLGRTHYFKGKFISSDLCFILTPKNPQQYPISLLFYHFIFNNLKRNIVRETKSGTSKESINITNFSNYCLPYFSIEKQTYWLEKFKTIDAVKEQLLGNLTEQIADLKLLRQTILQEAVQGKLVPQDPNDEPATELLKRIKKEKEKLGKKAKDSLEPVKDVPYEIPRGWEWCRLGEIINIISGVTLGKVYKKDVINVPYLRVANVQRGYIDISTLKHIAVPQEEIEKYTLHKGDIVMIEGGDWDKVGRCAIWKGEISPCIHQNHIFRLRFPEQLNNRWAEIFLNSPISKNIFKVAQNRPLILLQ